MTNAPLVQRARREARGSTGRKTPLRQRVVWHIMLPMAFTWGGGHGAGAVDGQLFHAASV